MNNKTDFRLQLNNDSKTINFDTKIAEVLSINQAIFIQKLYNFIKVNEITDRQYQDGMYWFKSTLDEWKERDFPFWCKKTISNIIDRLEKQGILITANHNKIRFDRTKWYSLDLDKLQAVIDNKLQ